MDSFVPTTLVNSLIGIVFVILAAVLTFLMFYVWKFPYDHQRHRSEAPPAAILGHRLLGYAFVVIYLYLMWQMVPRLWSYQIELPARTVLHLALGLSIGALLILKLAIVRFFKHLEARVVPFIGILLFVNSVLLVTLVLPFSLRGAYLERVALGNDDMVAARVERVRDLLPTAGLEDNELLADLASNQGLVNGRRILSAKCVQCHDLRTVLARPRTPRAWRQTVARMADRSTILNPITGRDQWFVTAYLVAVSPTLQETLKQRRQMEAQSREMQDNLQAAIELANSKKLDYAPAEARELFEQTCSQCHDHTQVEQAPPTNRTEVTALVQRMVANGLDADVQVLATIIRYLRAIYADVSTTATAAASAPGAGQIEGRTLYRQRFCAGCHGPGGRQPSSPDFPVLAGQNAAYLVRQFKDIRSGERANGMTATMSALVQEVSDAEIERIAAYLEAQR